MLYERWSRVAQCQAGEVALRDLAAGRQWLFSELFAAGEARDSGQGDVVYPQGHGAEFILALLAAWRTGKLACPLEPGQPPPMLTLPPPPCVHLKTTSATTAAARYVAFTAEQLAADAANVLHTMGLRTEWPNLGVISMAHSYGFSNLVLPLLLHGIPLTLVPSPLPEAIRQAAQEGRAWTLAAVPALWRAWHEADAIPSNLKLAISAGAPLPLALEQEVWAKRGLKIHNFYGSTECGGIAYDRDPKPRDNETFVGSPMHGVELSVAEHGCLVVHSLAVGQSYWPSPDASLAGSRFETADLAELREGRVFLRGRATDLINVAGRKVSPTAVERELLQHPAVRDCLVFGVPEPSSVRGDRIVACVVASVGMTGEPLKQFLLARVPAWQIPRDWWFVDSLPPNRVGKVSRAAWRSRYLQEKLPRV